jgi:hypothetical protein
MIIHSEQKVFSGRFVKNITKFDEHRPNYRHLTPKVDQNGFYPTHFLCHPNGLPDEILSTWLAEENRKMHPWTHSGKLSNNEMPGSFRQWTLIALVKIILHFDCLKTNGARRLQHDVTYVGSCTVTSILCLLTQRKCIELHPPIYILI